MVLDYKLYMCIFPDMQIVYAYQGEKNWLFAVGQTPSHIA